MTAVFEPPGQQSFFLTSVDVNGKPYTVPNAGGFVYMYQPGSTVPQTTWQDSGQNVANPNPIRLDADGRCIIFGVGQYRQVVTDASGDVQWDQLVELGIDQTFINTTLLNAPVTVSGPNPSPPLNTPDQGTRPLAAVLGSFVDARNGKFGALRQGGDDLTVIQSAINYAASIGGATVYLGPGPLQTSNNTQLVWPAAANGVCLKGDGPNNTTITISGAVYQDTFVLTAGNLVNCQIRDIGFSCPAVGTGGALIHFGNASAALVENIQMTGAIWNGVFIQGGPQQSECTIRDVIASVQSTSNAGIILGEDTSGPAQGITIDTCSVSNSQFGIYFRSCSGVLVSDTNCASHVQAGVITSPAPSRQARLIQMVGVFIGGCGGSGFEIGDSGGNTSFISMSNCYALNNLVGIRIGNNPQENNISVVGCQIHGNAQSGIHNVGANAVLITNNLLAGNGTAATNTYDTILVESGIQNVVSNNFIGPAFGLPAMQRYAINVGGPTDYFVVTGNVTGGGGTGSILNASAGTHNVVTNNTGT